MIGAILGDIIGSPYEFDRGQKTKDFPLFTSTSGYTDDTVLTIAIADALLNSEPTSESITASLQKWGNAYPYAGYGAMFSKWLSSPNPQPYNSYGNGSAMRVSSVGWLCSSLSKTLSTAALTASVSHNHPEGIKGAQSTAAAIYLARNDSSKTEIKNFIESYFDYDLSSTITKLRPDFYHNETCQYCVPAAFICFLESDSYEDAVRNAISLGGDTDTMGNIVGGIAEAFYGVPQDLVRECELRLPPQMWEIVQAVYENKSQKRCLMALSKNLKDLVPPQ